MAYYACMKYWIVLSVLLLLLGVSRPAHAGPSDQINDAFLVVWGREPSFEEWRYWAQRVQRGEKKTFQELVGAMGYQKVRGAGNSPFAAVAAATAVSSSAPAAKTFQTHRHLYPSPVNPNLLFNGTLIKSPAKPEIFYVKDGKKSLIIPAITNKWLGENHFYKHDIVLTVSDADFARYPQTSSVNPVYAGKVLRHPDGTQYYIDDRLRRRKISAAVRTALRFPGGNVYPTSAAHLQEFKAGPDLTGSTQPGGMVVYTGAFRGGRIWRIEENSAGTITKRLFLSDYLYEAWYYPDESQRVAVSEAELARYPRGSNIERYPDGWVVGLGGSISVVHAEALRLIVSPVLFQALGYNPKYVLKVFPEFLKRYPKGQPIAAFKNVVSSEAEANKSAPSAAPNAAADLTKVRPGIRALITQMNDIYLSVFDKDVTVAENTFWVDYVYNGEVDAKEDLVAAMKQAKASGQKPARTSRTAVLSEEALEQKWFPYLFYFVHQQEPDDADRAYWFARIKPGDRDTIEELGGTLQWLKDTTGATRK